MTLITKQMQHNFNQSANTYDKAAEFQRITGESLLERLDFLNIDPRLVVDLGMGTGRDLTSLQQRYPQASIIGLDLAHQMVNQAKINHPLAFGIVADAFHLPFADRTVDVIFSNLLIQWCEDLKLLFQECRRVLRPGGVFLFSTLGPDTLKELRQAWAIDPTIHVHRFVDMHDIGDVLLQACFLAPVVDRLEVIQSYKSVKEILTMLKKIGARNVDNARRKTLTGKNNLQKMIQAYPQINGEYPLTYEVIYGIAWGPKQSKT